MSDQDKKDQVTIGQIRRRYVALLDDQIETLRGLIHKGYQYRGQSEKFLQEAIGQTLTTLQNIDGMASAEVLFPSQDAKPLSRSAPAQLPHPAPPPRT